MTVSVITHWKKIAHRFFVHLVSTGASPDLFAGNLCTMCHLQISKCCFQGASGPVARPTTSQNTGHNIPLPVLRVKPLPFPIFKDVYLLNFDCAGSLMLHGLQRLQPSGLVAPQHLRSSRTRDRTRISCVGRKIPYHWATRETPSTLLKSKLMSFV